MCNEVFKLNLHKLKSTPIEERLKKSLGASLDDAAARAPANVHREVARPTKTQNAVETPPRRSEVSAAPRVERCQRIAFQRTWLERQRVDKGHHHMNRNDRQWVTGSEEDYDSFNKDKPPLPTARRHRGDIKRQSSYRLTWWRATMTKGSKIKLNKRGLDC